MTDSDMKFDTPPDNPLREKVLLDAIQAIINDREIEYGAPEHSFSAIADYWNEYIGHKLRSQGVSFKVDAYDVGIMMVLLNAARMEKRPRSDDSAANAAGYAACAAEVLHCQRNVTPLPKV